MARLAAKLAAARHPHAQPIRLDATLVHEVALGARRQRQWRVFELGLEWSFPGIR
jgi:hypothetical protein